MHVVHSQLVPGVSYTFSHTSVLAGGRRGQGEQQLLGQPITIDANGSIALQPDTVIGGPALLHMTVTCTFSVGWSPNQCVGSGKYPPSGLHEGSEYSLHAHMCTHTRTAVLTSKVLKCKCMNDDHHSCCYRHHEIIPVSPGAIVRFPKPTVTCLTHDNSHNTMYHFHCSLVS